MLSSHDRGIGTYLACMADRPEGRPSFPFLAPRPSHSSSLGLRISHPQLCFPSSTAGVPPHVSSATNFKLCARQIQPRLLRWAFNLMWGCWGLSTNVGVAAGARAKLPTNLRPPVTRLGGSVRPSARPEKRSQSVLSGADDWDDLMDGIPLRTYGGLDLPSALESDRSLLTDSDIGVQPSNRIFGRGHTWIKLRA